MTTLTIDSHPLLDASVFITHFPSPLEQVVTPAGIALLMQLGAQAPMTADDTVREAVRKLLRHGGFKPTGRSKPASEYLIKGIEEGRLGPQQGINVAVDTCNAVSLHSGLPISVVDLDLAAPPWRIGICPADTTYVFNSAGQVIDVSGLITLHDATGPCAGPVKDSQRTKTHGATTRTLSVVWGTNALTGRTAQTTAWYRQLLEQAGARTEMVTPR